MVMFDWDNATVKVTVPVQHTATRTTQEVEMPIRTFAHLLSQQAPTGSDDLPLAVLDKQPADSENGS